MNRKAKRARMKARIKQKEKVKKYEALLKAIDDGTTNMISRKLSASYILLTELLHITEEVQELHEKAGIGTGRLFNAFKKTTDTLEEFFRVFDKEILPGQDKYLIDDFESFDISFRKWANIEDKQDIAVRIRVVVERVTNVDGDVILSRRGDAKSYDARVLYWLALNHKGFTDEEIADISGFAVSTVKKTIAKVSKEIQFKTAMRLRDLWLELKKHL